VRTSSRAGLLPIAYQIVWPSRRAVTSPSLRSSARCCDTVESRILPDGQWVRSDRKHGTVYWSEASLHQVRNVGKTMSHTIRIELKY